MKLDDLVRDARESTPQPDWQRVDAALFERIDAERARLPARAEDGPRRLRWAPVTLSFAAAAAALLLVRSSSNEALAPSPSSDTTPALHARERIEARDARYFDTAAVRWMATAGSVLRVEHAAAPLVLSLEQGATEAQVTPVPSGEAFAVDITASSGAVVRVAVHGTHLRVARAGDDVVIDLTEGVVSIGAPPRRGSLIGELVTAPAHVTLDARDLSSMRVEHALASVRTAEPVTATRTESRVAMVDNAAPQPLLPGPMSEQPVVAPKVQQGTGKSLGAVQAAPAPNVDPWLHTPVEVVSAIEACTQVAPNTVFSTTLTMRIGDDGSVQGQPLPRFDPPLPPEARDCAANVLYKRVKLSTPGDVSIPIEIKP